MSTSMTHDSSQHIGTSTQTIEARALDITAEDGSTVAWASSPDVAVALHWGQMAKGVHLPSHGEGGLVVVGLDPEDDHHSIHEVVTQGTGTRTDVEVVERTIAVLQQVHAGLIAAQGGAR